MNLNDRVKVIKINPFSRPWLKKYRGRIGIVTEIVQVMPSKRVPDGLVFKVHFHNLLPQKFITSELKVLDKP